MDKIIKIREIRIEYVDGTFFNIDAYDLDKIEKLSEAVNMLERAKSLYQQLQPVFKKID